MRLLFKNPGYKNLLQLFNKGTSCLRVNARKIVKGKAILSQI